jgi:2-keto-4-pentenoate hydratase/2-oxohepta-3-ene-1,7-dioic acid hydratase in catechol pathway
MRYCRFSVRGTVSFGVALDERHLVDLPRAASAHELVMPDSPEGLIAGGEKVAETVARLHALLRTQDEAARAESLSEGIVVRLPEARLEAPLTRPSKIVGVGLNYADHCREQNLPPPTHPVLFAKFPSALTGPLDVIRWDARLSHQVDVEAELAVVIGKRARQISREWALAHVFGYTALNDVSARDLQQADRQWVRAKSFDTFCPLGPWIVTTDEIPDPGILKISSSVNGRVLQESNTAAMVFGVPELIAFISEAITLEPGDIIATGTPAGVGVFRKPSLFLKDGDEVTVEIERIGALRNRVSMA